MRRIFEKWIEKNDFELFAEKKIKKSSKGKES